MNMLVTHIWSLRRFLSVRSCNRPLVTRLNIVERVSVSDRTGPRVIIFWGSDTEERPGCTDHVKSAAEHYHTKKSNGAQQG